MNRRQALALVMYAALMGSLVTPLYDPLSAGRDDSWALVVLLAAAHLGVGIAVCRAWAVLLPVGLCVASFALAGAEGLAWLILLFELPALVAVTALGWLIGSRSERYGRYAAATAFVVAALPSVWAALETADRGPHVSAREQRALPTWAYTLIDDRCSTGDPRFDRMARRRARRQLAALERSLGAHPDAVVGVRFTLADAPGIETREMTIRELAETHLAGSEPGRPQDIACYRSERERLQGVLDETG